MDESAERSEMKGQRGTGKTLAMVQNLTGEPTICVVHTSEMKRYLENMIRNVMGEEVAANTKVVIISASQDVYKLRGRSDKILVDHTFWFSDVDRDTVNEIQFLQMINRRREAK